MIHLNIEKPYRALKLEKPLKKAAESTIHHQKIYEDCDLTLAVTGDAQIKRLNDKFRGENHATDVLSFPTEGSEPQTNSRYLGDIVISLPRAKAQAKVGGHGLEAELQLLTIHGILHLLGYDHSNDGDKAEMWAAENEILDSLGITIRAEQAEKAYSTS